MTDPALRQRMAQNGLEFASVNDWEHKKHLYLDLVDALTSKSRPTNC
jgi:hypothetical protein